MEGDKTIRVSDWSQKYKLILYLLGLMLAVFFVVFRLIPWMNEVTSLLQNLSSNGCVTLIK